jgi:hypothetical protein
MSLILRLFIFVFCGTFLVSSDFVGADESHAVNEVTETVETPSQAAVENWPVTFNEQVAFVLHVPLKSKSGPERAQDARRALKVAIESSEKKSPEAPLVDYEKVEDEVVLHVRGYAVATLTAEDAVAAGARDLDAYAEELTTSLKDFVPRQREKIRIQDFFMHFFLSVFFALMGFLILRQIQKIFDRFDHVIDEKKDSFGSISMMSETFLTGETIGGMVALGLTIGRFLAYGVTIITAVAAVFSQYALTRNLLLNSLGAGARQFFQGFENLVALIPSFLLAVVLIIIFQACLKALGLYSKGVQAERIRWRLVPPHRVRVFRIFLSLLLVLIFAPLILGALFGKFDTPFMTLFLLFSAVVALSLLPFLFNWSVGMMTIWKYNLKPGDWIQVGKVRGEIAQIELDEISVVPEGGGSIRLPMVRLAFEALHRQPAPKTRLLLEVLEAHDPKILIDQLRLFFPKAEDVQIRLISYAADRISLSIALETLNEEAVQQVLLELPSFCRQQKLLLSRCEVLKNP